MPHREQISENGKNEQKLDLYKLLAELSSNCGPLETQEKKVEVLYNTLLVRNINSSQIENFWIAYVYPYLGIYAYPIY